MTDSRLVDRAVLIVEDDPDMQFLLKSMVREFGVQSIETAHDGSIALSVMQSTPIDLVLCDIRMQPMDGLEFVKAVRGGHRGVEQSVPIILLTAHSDMERVTEAGVVGVDGFVTKPVSADKLHKRLLSVVTKPRSSLIATRRSTVARIADLDEVDADAAERARAVVAKLAGAYVERAMRDIEALDDAYAHAVAHPAERGGRIARIADIAHDVEGQGGSFGYPLMSAIGASLSELSRTTNQCDDAHLKLVKAHIDAMRVVIDNRIAGDGGARGARVTVLVELLRDAVSVLLGYPTDS